LAARSAGDGASNSKFVMLAAPWRREVPMQSAPVSPPPMTMTFKPAAEM
jgi:hypothetical protein